MKKSLSLLAFFIFPALVHGQFSGPPTPAPVPFDDRQKAIVTKVIDKVIDDLKLLKKKYPELEHFGEAPYFTRAFGEFRYDYKTKETNLDGMPVAGVEPGGCGMFVQLAPDNSTPPKWWGYYGGGHGLSGDTRAGITLYFSIKVDPQRQAIADAIQQAVLGELEAGKLYDGLASEYLLQNKHVKTDTASLLQALLSPYPDVSNKAISALRLRNLTAKELATVRQALGESPHPESITDGVLAIVMEQDNKDLPEVCMEITRATFQIEKQGRDSFTPVPFFGVGPLSNAESARSAVVWVIVQNPDPRFIDVASLILNEDNVTQDRLAILDYFGKLPGPAGREALIKALDNPFRSVQEKAAGMVADKNIHEAAPKLEALLGSPSSKVRKSAADALVKLGRALPAREPARTLPKAAVDIANALWANGLDEKDVVFICAKPTTDLFPMSPPEPVPDQSKFPEGVSFEENHPFPQKNQDGTDAPPMRSWRIKLTDPWRMSKMDRESVGKRTAQYVAGFGLYWGWSKFDITGPFLLAAAVKVGDDKSARQIYEYLCDQFETDDALLDCGITAIGWTRFEAALDKYQRKKDDEALPLFHAVAALEKYNTTPFSLLDGYIRQSKAIITELQQRRKEPQLPLPDPSDKAATIRYWVSRIWDINGIVPGQPADAAIWFADCGGLDDIPQAPFASDKLRETGLETLPYLVDALDDQTHSRTVYYWRDFVPVRTVLTVSRVAREIFVVICADYGLKPPIDLVKLTVTPATPDKATKQKQLREWISKIPPGTKKLSDEEIMRFRNKEFYGGMRFLD